MVRNIEAWLIKSMLVPKIRLMRPPEGLKKMRSMPQMIMVEIKCGAYSTVCTTRLSFWKRSWLSASARMIGTGKLHSRLYRLMSTVLTIMRPQLGEEKNRSNHSNPTHSLPQMPRLALKSRKAI